ncbi:MAG: ATP-grasp domain-containing protein [Actinomycetota bacterium]|nr:ATP-grasp domain-containing protein [Actinomycetota bacterium]
MTAVLFTCAGMRVDIVTAFRRAGATTVAADASALAPALYSADAFALVPLKDDPAYIPALRDIVTAHAVDLVVPLTDIDQQVVSERRGELGAPVLLPDHDVVLGTSDKYRAQRILEELCIDSPQTWLPDELPGELPFPVLVKARMGYGGRHIYRAHDREELRFFLAYTPVASIVQEYCGGEEFSVDTFSDWGGNCLNAIPRTMLESKGGESIKGMTIDDPELIELGRRVAEALRLRGPATIQCFRAGGRHLVTDVNPRFGGAFPLPFAAGSRYPELALALANGERPEPRVGEFRAGIVMTRYLSDVCLVDGGDGTFEPVGEAVAERIRGS